LNLIPKPFREQIWVCTHLLSQVLQLYKLDFADLCWVDSNLEVAEYGQRKQDS